MICYHTDLMAKPRVVEFSRPLLVANTIDHSTELPGVRCPFETTFCPLSAKDLLLTKHLIHLFLGISAFLLYNFIDISFVMIHFTCSYIFWDVLFHIHSVFVDVGFLNGFYTSAGKVKISQVV